MPCFHNQQTNECKMSNIDSKHDGDSKNNDGLLIPIFVRHVSGESTLTINLNQSSQQLMHLYAQKTKTKHECQYFVYTTGNRHFAECRRLCRVYFIWHSAKTVFAECQIKYTRQNASLPSAFFLALGKDVFCRVLFFGTRQNASLPSAFFLALGKDVFFRVSLFWYSAKMHFVVCIFFWSWANQFFKAIFEAINEF